MKPADPPLLERPMGPRSVIASLLLGMHPPRLSSARLVRWCSLFGITENAARVALSRMAERGELRAHDGVYELAGGVRHLQPAQEWALAPALEPYDGSWVLLVVTADRRPAGERSAFRAAARAARLAELREGVWGRPDNLPPAATPPDARARLAAHATRWHAVPDEPPDVAARFGLPQWQQRAESLAGALTAATASLGTGSDRIPDAFVAGAAVLQHLRRDPLLPPELLPAGWPGAALREVYLRYQPRFAEAVAAFLRAG